MENFEQERATIVEQRKIFLEQNIVPAFLENLGSFINSFSALYNQFSKLGLIQKSYLFLDNNSFSITDFKEFCSGVVTERTLSDRIFEYHYEISKIKALLESNTLDILNFSYKNFYGLKSLLEILNFTILDASAGHCIVQFFFKKKNYLYEKQGVDLLTLRSMEELFEMIKIHQLKLFPILNDIDLYIKERAKPHIKSKIIKNFSDNSKITVSSIFHAFNINKKDESMVILIKDIVLEMNQTSDGDLFRNDLLQNLKTYTYSVEEKKNLNKEEESALFDKISQEFFKFIPLFLSVEDIFNQNEVLYKQWVEKENKKLFTKVQEEPIEIIYKRFTDKKMARLEINVFFHNYFAPAFKILNNIKEFDSIFYKQIKNAVYSYKFKKLKEAIENIEQVLIIAILFNDHFLKKGKESIDCSLELKQIEQLVMQIKSALANMS